MEMMRRKILHRQVKLLQVICVASVLLCSLWGCLPEPLDVKGLPVVKPQIVVSTQIIPDQSVIVLLTKTFGALDASDDSDPEALLDQIAVNDATVTITGPQGEYELEFFGPWCLWRIGYPI